MADPARYLLGVDASAAPLTLLGMRAPEAHDRDMVEAALERRMRRVCDHPAGQTPEAASLAWILCLATEVILDPRLHRQALGEPPWLDHIRSALVELLGVRAPGDPFTVLELAVAPVDRKAVHTALFKSLNRIYGHDDRRSAAGEFARATIRAAARALKNPEWQQIFLRALQPSPQRRSRAIALQPAVRLTHFDRQAMAILVGEGGWNRRSRSRLVSLASGHGVTVAGLMKIITGLSDYAKAGGPRLGLPEITAGASHGPVGLPDPMAPRTSMVEIDSLKTRLSGEMRDLLQEDSAVSRVKLSMYFGITTIALSVFILQLVLSASHSQSKRSSQTAESAPISAAPTEPGSKIETSPGRAGAISPAFARYPTMLGNARPAKAIDTADQIHSSIADLKEVLARLAVTDEPAEPVFRKWETAVSSVAQCWVLLDLSTREEINGLIAEVFIAVGQPTVRERFWEGLSAFRADRAAEPLDLWRGAWFVGTLATLSRQHYLPPAVIEQARRGLTFALPEIPLAEVTDFDTAVWRWLMQATPTIARATDLDPAAADRWELWIAAMRKVVAGDRWNEGMMVAVQSMMRTGTDLARSDAAAGAIGRLLSLVDLEENLIARRRTLELFDDELVTSHDLWVFTSMFTLIPDFAWCDASLILAHDADLLSRARWRDRFDRAWPESVALVHNAEGIGVGLSVNLEAMAQWQELVDLTADRVPFDVSVASRQLVAASLLNEAVGMMAAQNLQRALPALDAARALLTGSARLDPPDAVTRAGQAIGPDGVWAERYQKNASNSQERLDLLSDLVLNAGSDLGQMDAALLVREAYRGNDRDVRTAARSAILDRFSNGSTVAMELLDQLPVGSISKDIIELVREVSGRVLPPRRTPGYEAEVRLALVQHVLATRSALDTSTDVAALRLMQSYAWRYTASRREGYPSIAPRTPEEAVRLLVESLHDRASTMMTTNPAPDDLDRLRQRDIARMRLAVGSVQKFVAAQLAALDLLVYIASAERPGVRRECLAVLRESAQRRARYAHVLEQALEVERAMLALWHLRLMSAREGRSSP